MKRFICLAITLIILFTGCEQRGGSTDEVSASRESESVSVSDTEPASIEPESDEETDEVDESGTSDVGYTPLVTVSITIPEGYTLPRVGMLLEQKGICTAEEFIAASQEGDFSDFSLIAAQKPDEHRCFKLEGYLFPDTYEIYETDLPDAIIRKILEHTERKFSSELRAKIDASGYTADEILAMASIIEKEAFGEEHMPMISSVLHNRLDMGMKLQCDVSITYVEGAIKPFITGDIDRYNAYYNTYKCAALPAGAICNPGMAAIKAALEPTDTDFVFFLTDKEKNYYYAEKWEEHEENVKKYI